MCFQKFFELVSGFSGRRDVVPFCGCSYSECAIARFAAGPRNGNKPLVLSVFWYQPLVATLGICF